MKHIKYLLMYKYTSEHSNYAPNTTITYIKAWTSWNTLGWWVHRVDSECIYRISYITYDIRHTTCGDVEIAMQNNASQCSNNKLVRYTVYNVHLYTVQCTLYNLSYVRCTDVFTVCCIGIAKKINT